jgi:pyruvate/2-oxoglutarate dehydrogenase complex dihydrolipoamide acyltransferase (E2) component
VSALEGGYRIQGGVVSAFSRSVAAHVAALADRGVAPWDGVDAAWERGRERAKRAEVAAARAAAAAAAAAAAEAAAAAAVAAAAAGEHVHPAPSPPPPAAPTADPGGDDDRAKRRRRGGGVDYVALNAKLEAEAASKKAGG